VAIVHLFEWRWDDIADECERFLGPMGYCGVQVSPPNEHMVDSQWQPWWQRYQPVSYKLQSRSGNENLFKQMVERCNNVGVRIYVDAIINHMAGVDRSGIGSGGSEFVAEDGHFPGVPYSMGHFHSCQECGSGCCCVDSWTDMNRVRVCRLSGLIDLKQSLSYVQDMIAGYMNNLIGIGVAGFRIDAAKHMYPEDIEAIWGKLNNLNTRWFPSGAKPFMFLEVIDLNQNGEIRAQWYTHLGRVTDFRFCVKVKDAAGQLSGAQWLYDPGWGMLDSEDAFVFVDNHDNQRGHGGGGEVVTHKDPYKYQMAQALALSNGYGYPRVMSSYAFEDSEKGPPASADGTTNRVPINPDGSCGGGWVCEHRWPVISGMASFSKAVSGTSANYWWSEGNQVAIGREGKGFFVATNQGGLERTFPTGMPSGDYCNVIQGCPTSSGCSGDTIHVDGSGNAHIRITDGANPIAAIHVEARSGSGGCIN